MSFSRWFLAGIGLATFLSLSQGPAWGQEEPVSPEQVIARYMEAIGGTSRFSTIMTLVEKGDLSGNLTDFGIFLGPPTLGKQQGTFERYFKAPNLRSSVVLTEKNEILTMSGCDGASAWFISPGGHHSVMKPKPGNAYGCETGYDPSPRTLRSPKVKLRLKGKEKVGDQLAFAVWAQDPGSQVEETYYFDAKTYLLIRWKSVLPGGRGSFKIERFYSDYREVGGIKLPFDIIQQTDRTKLVTTVREVKINAPLEDAWFAEPGTKGHAEVGARGENPPSGKADKVEVLPPSPSEMPATSNTATVAKVNNPDFASCSIVELQELVPELRRLKAAQGQEELTALLDKVGAKTAELARETPDLIAHEAVDVFQQGGIKARQNFSYLILSLPRNQDVVTLKEFRVDLLTGESLQIDDAKIAAALDSPASSTVQDLVRTRQQASERKSGGPPLSQGFASMWVYFYPANQAESVFRYVGEQKMDGHRTLVLTFAQRPDSVRLPTDLRLDGKSIPVFFQGVAWVDASDFRIVRLRTDLLAPVPEVALSKLTADIQFAETPVAGVGSPLWLPREVVVTTGMRGGILRDEHKYSDYRAFRVQTKMLPSQ